MCQEIIVITLQIYDDYKRNDFFRVGQHITCTAVSGGPVNMINKPD